MSDRELVEQVTRGRNRNAFADIVRRHSAAVFSRAISILHSEEAAAEVVQMTFVRAYENLASWRGTALAPWLTAIASFTALKLIDKERRHRSVPLEQASNLTDKPDNSYSAEHEERLRLMDRAIDALPEADQLLLRLHYYEHLTTAEIARRTGLTQANVLVRLHRIRARLKKEINSYERRLE